MNIVIVIDIVIMNIVIMNTQNANVCRFMRR